MRGVRLLIVSSALSYQPVLFETISTVGSLQAEIVIRTTKVGGLETERPIENQMQNLQRILVTLINNILRSAGMKVTPRNLSVCVVWYVVCSV